VRTRIRFSVEMKDSETAAALGRKSTEPEERSRAGSLLAHRKHAITAPRTRRRQCAQAAKSYWNRLSPEDRVREMRRRRKIGVIRKKRAALNLAENE
jgi:hypothetical protein